MYQGSQYTFAKIHQKAIRELQNKKNQKQKLSLKSRDNGLFVTLFKA